MRSNHSRILFFLKIFIFILGLETVTLQVYFFDPTLAVIFAVPFLRPVIFTVVELTRLMVTLELFRVKVTFLVQFFNFRLQLCPTTMLNVLAEREGEAALAVTILIPAGSAIPIVTMSINVSSFKSQFFFLFILILL